MSLSVAVAGKGGTGKTTFSSLLIRYLLGENKKPILAVDADPNANLGDALGLEIEDTVGDICEEMLRNKDNLPAGMAKTDYLNLKIERALIESSGMDLLSMGRPEGPGCYCYTNNLLRSIIDKISSRYPYLIMDNEAGLEHLSRKTTRDVDFLLIVSDPTVRGLKTVQRIHQMVSNLKISVGKQFLVLNRAKPESSSILSSHLEKVGIGLAGVIPEDELIYEYDGEGKPLVELPAESTAVKAVKGIVEKLGI
ncbi:MAG: AAA family ATPase [Nitrospirae bacterium]|nr:AAA family ATPase [Nitrospirota bacterium]